MDNSSSDGDYYDAEYVETLKLFALSNRIQFYVLAATSVLSLVGNSISVSIYLTKEFRKKNLGTYFIAHGIFDTLFILSMLFFQIQPFLFPQYITFCHLTILVQSISQFATSWIQTINSIDRVVLITMPSRMLFMRRLRFQLIMIFSIIIISGLLTIPNLMNMYQDILFGELICAEKYDNNLNMFYYFVSCIIFYFVIPFFIMLTCSIIIIIKLRKKSNELNVKGDERKHRDHMITKTLLYSNIYFLIVMLPYGIFSLLRVYIKTFEFYYFVYNLGLYGTLMIASLTPILLYHSTMLIVHLKANKSFRKVFSDFLLKYFKIKLFQ